MKAISVRIEDSLSRKFDKICRETGYKKNTVIVRLLEAYVKAQASQSTARRERRKAIADPFLKAIGMLDLPPLLDSEDAIDRIVYEVV